MRGKWHIVLICAALVCGALVPLCHRRAQLLDGEAVVQRAQSVHSGHAFVRTLSGGWVSSQLGQLDRSRALIRGASHWREGMLFSLLGLVFFAFSGYVMRVVETAFEREGLDESPAVRS